MQHARGGDICVEGLGLNRPEPTGTRGSRGRTGMGMAMADMHGSEPRPTPTLQTSACVCPVSCVCMTDSLGAPRRLPEQCRSAVPGQHSCCEGLPPPLSPNPGQRFRVQPAPGGPDSEGEPNGTWAVVAGTVAGGWWAATRWRNPFRFRFSHPFHFLQLLLVRPFVRCV
jgi:hypothetical protein